MSSSLSSSLPTASSQLKKGERHSVGSLSSTVCTATTTDELVGSNSNANSNSISLAVVADVMNTADIYEGVLISVFNFLSQQESLRELTVVSKHFYKIVHYGDEENATVRTRKGIEFQLIPLFEITPTKGGNIETFADNMHRHSLNNETMDTLQNYHRIRVIYVNLFITHNSTNFVSIVRKLRGIRMEGIRTIDTTLPLPLFAREPYVFFAFAYMDLPNLREIIFSNIADSGKIVRRFSQTFPLLETMSICNSFESSSLDDDDYSLRGYSMRDCNNVRSITMNDCDFYSRDMDQLADLTRHDNVFIFHDCFTRNTNLERISIRGIQYTTFTTPATNHKIPQNALIKLVRNAPASLKSFRSDLTTENIKMLHTERDELGKSKIELLN